MATAVEKVSSGSSLSGCIASGSPASNTGTPPLAAPPSCGRSRSSAAFAAPAAGVAVITTTTGVLSAGRLPTWLELAGVFVFVGATVVPDVGVLVDVGELVTGGVLVGVGVVVGVPVLVAAGVLLAASTMLRSTL